MITHIHLNSHRDVSHRDADHKLNRNVFVETTLSYVLSYIVSKLNLAISPASIIILADNDYYSTPADVASTSRFHNFGVPLSQSHKTGLGSSAALVTAIAAALLGYYLPSSEFDLSHGPSRRRLHNLAQAAHCAAQGKVGSGFDVASAVYGTCLYRRFSPAFLESHAEPGVPKFGSELRGIVDETGHGGEWDVEIVKDAVQVPPGLRLVMCDVSGGSETPGMVKQVLAWRKEKPAEANALWSDLQAANEDLAREMKAAATMSSESRDFAALRACFARIRTYIRRMSELSGVPIEPASQTELIDACEKVPGVIGGVVPGAGGYDAIALLIEGGEDTVAQLKALFSSWTFSDDGKGDERRVSVLGVREEMEGVRVEDAHTYAEWLT